MLRSIPLIYFFLVFGSSVSLRIILNRVINYYSQTSPIEEILIYGAGKNGVALSRFLNETQNKKTIFYIDDDKLKQNRNIGGVKIVSFEDFKKIISIKNYKIYISIQNSNIKLYKVINSLSFEINCESN